VNRGDPTNLLTGSQFALTLKKGKGEETPIAQEKPPQRPQDAPQEPTASNEHKSRSQAFWEWLGLGKGGEKTGLELLQVIAAISIPVVVVIMGAIFTASQSRSQQQVEEQRAQDEALQAYFEDMGHLLLDEDLRDAENDAEVISVARARTLSVLDRVDPKRRRSIFLFLKQAKLIAGGLLRDANLSGIDLSREGFADAGLSRVNLSGANLRGVNIGGNTDLYGADLTGADLTGAKVGSNAGVYRSGGPSQVYEGGVSLDKIEGPVTLSSANLTDATLKDADLTDVVLSDATLKDADLTNATLKNTNLQRANLEGAKVTREQLAESGSLEETTMPDGSTHD
jgi:uncharacterized protein YjbI with pentapeptide repeats